MAEKKTSKKVEKEKAIEKEFVIPLREKCRPVARYKKANKAVKTIKEYVVRHMKIRDRDLKKVRIDRALNEAVWFRGIKKPPYKVKVKVTQEPGEDFFRVFAMSAPKIVGIKLAKQEKREAAGTEVAKKKKAEKKPEEKPEEKTASEEKAEDEKKESVKEEMKEAGEMKAKGIKHDAKVDSKKPKHQFRQALQK